MNKEPNWLPTQPTELAVAEAVFGATPVRALIDEGMVDVHWLDDGSPVVDWSDLASAVPIWQRWNVKSKAARRAAANILAQEEWLAGLLTEHEQQVREQIKAEAKVARRTAIQRNYFAQKKASGDVVETTTATVNFDDLLAEMQQ